MRKLTASLLASSLAAAALAFFAATPAQAEHKIKTELVAPDGASVDHIPMHYRIDSAWIVDKQNILYRDITGEYFLVSLKEPCEQLLVRGRGFDFVPPFGELYSSHIYEVWPVAGPRRAVTRIEHLPKERADTLREASLRRVWDPHTGT